MIQGDCRTDAQRKEQSLTAIGEMIRKTKLTTVNSAPNALPHSQQGSASRWMLKQLRRTKRALLEKRWNRRNQKVKIIRAFGKDGKLRGSARFRNRASARGFPGLKSYATLLMKHSGTAARQPPSNKHRQIKLGRSDRPMDAIGNTDAIFYGAWPLLFPLHQGLHGSKKGLSQNMHTHLLTQFSNVFAQEQDFLFAMFNFHTRKMNNQQVNTKLMGRINALEDLGNTVVDDEFSQRLARAKKDPSGNAAQEVLRLVNPFLRLTGSTLPFSAYEQSGFYRQLVAMGHRFGEASYWVTVSPGTDTLSLRLSFPTYARRQFPATSTLHASEGGKTLREGLCDPEVTELCLPVQGTYEQHEERRFDGNIEQTCEEIPMIFKTDRVNLNKYAADNPVACAHLFSHILEAIFDVLLGISSAQHQRKTHHTEETMKRKGVFGRARACAAAAEVQARKALHVHLLVWSSLSPRFIQWAASCPALMRRIEAVIESHILAHVPVEYHVHSLLNQERKTKPMNAFRSCQNSPLVPYTQSARKNPGLYLTKDRVRHERAKLMTQHDSDGPSKQFENYLYPFMCYTQVR